MFNIQAPINTLGYGVVGYNILKNIYQIDNSVSLYPIGGIQYNDDFISQSIINSFTPNKNRATIKIWHQNDLFSSVPGKLYIGYPIFELDTFDNIEMASLNHCDIIFVCSHWAQDVILNNLGDSSPRVCVIPLGVDSNIFFPDTIRKTDTTIFLNCGKWEKRKGHDILLECFNLAFEKEDNVELWMICDNPFIGEKNNEWQKKYKNSKLGDKIKIIPRQQTQEDIARIMNMADCGVFPARAEGWNLELLEMMACGKQIIATNYSAHTEFCNIDNSMLTNIEELEVAFDGVFFDGKKGCWAALLDRQKDNIINDMRLIYKRKQDGELAKINTAGVDTAKKFTWKNSVETILNIGF